MIQIKTFTFGPFAENTYIVSDSLGNAMIVDPGCCETDECETLDRYIQMNKLKIKLLLNTHCHVDHVQGNHHVKKSYEVPFVICKEDEPTLNEVAAYAPSLGFVNYIEVKPDKYVVEGDTIEIGQMIWKVLFLPGHSPGHVGFYCEAENVILSGDVLFEGSIGRTDLPGGDYNTLLKSIHEKLFVLPDSVVVYAGHGRPTTIGRERYDNPYCGLKKW